MIIPQFLHPKIQNITLLFLLIACMACTASQEEEGKINIPTLDLWVDQYEVSINEFQKFIDENDYITTSDSIGWSGVFNISTMKWDMAEGANWEKPLGLKKQEGNYPVTQVSYMDACAYCAWKKGRLPTAKEWDAYAGDEIIRGNVWEGPFPQYDSGKDGYPKSIAPIGKFAPNENEIHDLFGNVWEWTSSEQSPNIMIIKGGSFLCDISFCSGYIPSKYQTTAKDSGLNHLGFRCVYDK